MQNMDNRKDMRPLLLVSYGAPEQSEEVVPFLNNLFAGKNVSAERRAAAAQKYERFAEKNGHYSPLNSECRKLIDGIKHLAPDLPIYWGNLFWHPLLVDTIAEMAAAGIKRAVCFATSAFDSPSGNKQYSDALESARHAIGQNAPILEKLPLPFDHPLFIEAQTNRLLETMRAGSVGDHCSSRIVQRADPAATLRYTPGFDDTPAHVLFSAHSIPLTDAERSHYVEQLQSACRSVIQKSRTSLPWDLVYQSRSGAAEHWLGPDIEEHIVELAAWRQVESLIVSPIGFFCENMETEYDLDVEVGGRCAALGFSFHRAKAVGAMPEVCRLIVELAENAV